MKRIRKRYIGLLIFLLILNNDAFITRGLLYELTGASNLVEFDGYTTLHGEVHHTEGFQFPVKGNTYWALLTALSQYRRCNPTSPDTVLYRTFRMRPLQFWNWINYFTHPRWRHPYLDPHEVKPFAAPPPTRCPEYYPNRPLLDSLYIK